MSGHGRGGHSWADRIRHWLWLDRNQRTDNSEANRGFYPGGPPVYVNRKPVSWRFVLPVVVIDVVIALIILATRGAAAQPAEEGQRVVLEEPGFAVTPHSTYEFAAGGARMRLVCRAPTPPADRWLSLAESITGAD